MTQILHIDSSARIQGSASREASAALVAALVKKHGPETTVVTRDVNGTPHIDETWVGATFTPPEARNAAQNEALSLSDSLVAEVAAADVIVVGAAMYNFNITSTLKAYLDQLSRAGVTFQYTETGPKGLLAPKPVYVAMASGGTPVGAPIDFLSPYLKHALGFIGLSDVTVLSAADALDADARAAALAQ